MADTFTAHYNWTKPAVGGDPDTWGGLLNTDLDNIDSQVYTASTYALPLTGGALTGALSITETASVIALTLTNTAGVGSGVGLKLVGDGSTTPSKTMRAAAGAFQIVNDANTAAILTLTDAGALSIVSNFTPTGGITAGGNIVAGGGTLQAGLSSGSYTTLNYLGALATNRTINPASAAALLLNLGGSYGGGLHIQDGTYDWGIYDTAGVLTFAAGTSGGALTAALSLGPAGVLTLTGTGTNGAQYWLYGNGGTTPNKMIRARAGNLEFVNSANTAIISSLSDAGYWTATDFTATSDARLKSNRRPLKAGYEELKRAFPEEYDKRGPDGKQHHEAGFIAQKLREVLPSAVFEDENGILSVSTPQTLAMVARAVLDIGRALELEGIL
jgi:hypothetical protein